MNSTDFCRTPKLVETVRTEHRSVSGIIPDHESQTTIEKSMQFEPQSMLSDLPLVWNRARGYQVFDSSNNCWIDFTSCIFVANIGHGHPKVLEAMQRALTKPLVNAYYYPTKARADFAEFLINQLPAKLNTVLFLSTGAESTEVATKIAFIHGQKCESNREYILAFEGSFHGKTMGAQTLGGKESGKKWVRYHHPKIMHLPYPYPWILEEKKQTGREFFVEAMNNLLSKGISFDKIAAIMMEPYQGWCGVFFPADFMKALEEWAHQNGVLIGFDEVQAGFGRTGSLFGFQVYEDLVPDIIWCGKAISSSIPVSAVIADRSLLNVDLSLNSTHGGNPIGMEAGKASLEVLIEENLVTEAYRKGKLVEQILKQWAAKVNTHKIEIFGRGLMWAILIRDSKTGELQTSLVDRHVEECFRQGVLTIRTMSGSIKLGPPLSIPDDALIEGLEVITSTFDRLALER